MNKSVAYKTTSGHEIRIRHVPHLVMEHSATEIDPPQVPMILNKSTKEMIENPNDPDYLRALEKYQEARERAMLDTMVSYSVITEDKMPDKRTLVKELKDMDEAAGGTLLDGYDLKSQRDLDVLWKKFYLLGAAVDMHALQRHAMVQWEDVRKALDSFRTTAEG